MHKYDIWKQRRTASVKSPWGWAYSVYDEDTEEDDAHGWRATEDEAIAAAMKIIKEHDGPPGDYKTWIEYCIATAKPAEKFDVKKLAGEEYQELTRLAEKGKLIDGQLGEYNQFRPNEWDHQ